MIPTTALQLFTCAALAAATLAGSAPATAAAGSATPIDQAQAMAGGVTPGDAAGFPITLSRPGVYKLTSHLSPGQRDGIVVTAPGVTIDLNGYSIEGPARCSRQADSAQVRCSGAADTRVGIRASQAVVVRNGTVRGFGGHGLLSTRGAVVEDMSFTMNGRYGAFMTQGDAARAFHVRRSSFDLNALAGLVIDGGVVEASVASNNGGDGIIGLPGLTLVADSQALANRLAGVRSAAVRGTVAAANLGGDLQDVQSPDATAPELPY